MRALIALLLITTLTYGQETVKLTNFSTAKSVFAGRSIGDSVIMPSINKAVVIVARKSPDVIIINEITVVNPGADNDIAPNLQAAINAAKDGYNIIIPAGKFKALSTVVASKQVNIVGNGIGKTILYRPESMSDGSLQDKSILQVIKDKSTVTGVTFISKDYKTSVAEDIGIEVLLAREFIIKNCRFENFGNGAVSVRHDDSLVSGLICKNEFYHNKKDGADGMGLGLGYGVVVYGSNKTWIKDPRFGSSNFIFVEDNTFDYHRHSIAAGGAALYVFRYNTITNNYIKNCCAHAIDAHGGNGTMGSENRFSARAVEIYNNTITNTTNYDGSPIVINGNEQNTIAEKAICLRGAEGLIYNNTIKGFRFGVTLTTTDPSAVLKNIPNVYIWNNEYVSPNAKNSALTMFYTYNSTLILNKDYYFIAKPGYNAYTYPHPLRK